MLKEKRSIYSNFGDGIYSLSDIEKNLAIAEMIYVDM